MELGNEVLDVRDRLELRPRRWFFTTAIAAHGEPDEAVTDRAAALANVVEELLAQALHNTTKCSLRARQNERAAGILCYMDCIVPTRMLSGIVRLPVSACTWVVVR